MKRKFIILVLIFAAITFTACKDYRRNPGRVYMPDMTYSRAYETYASTDELKKENVNYTAMPVPGTIARGDMTWTYPYKNDSAGYAASKTVTNPLPQLDSIQLAEAGRLYLIYCGICHGQKLDGMGPLYNGGNGPFTSAPKNFMADDMKSMPEGTMFHSATYGKNMMGSYASQLSTKQRWMVIAFIKSQQAKATAAAPPASGNAKDSTAAKTGK
jgi:mono/diheme cytochrome c family protein